MLRDLKIFRRNSGKKSNLEEIENLPINPTDSSVIQTGSDAIRPPLNTIPEPTQTPKSVPEPESGFRSKLDRTPSKVQGKGSNAPWSLRTPEKQLGFQSRNKFGWAQKNESSSNGTETRDEGRTDMNHIANNLPPSSRVASFGNGGLTNLTPRSVRTMGRATTNHSECSSTQSTPTKSVTKPLNPGMIGSRPPVNMAARAANSAALSKGISMSCTPPLVVNMVEVPHFELREDPSFWMDHNVQVLIRVRPLNSMERSSHGYNRCLKQESAQSIAWVGQPETRFTFDHVACEMINQEMLFRVAGLPMVENCMSGYNSCMFAYGQTGSGKTYTMLGEIDELEVKPSPHRGMTPRIFEFLFARIRAEEESRRDEKLKYNCKCSFLEIYNEQITDLLDPSSTNLLIREDIMKGVYVENLTEFEVETVNDILKLLTQGAANRKVAATNMNRESSRSHCVFTCVIESRWEKDSATNLRFARLNLVDLAGSERQKTSGAEGERLKEAANINKSLSTLGHVIMILVDVAHGKQRHIPYRDSRLTFLLQDSLGGNSKTMIIANVSPSICCAAETLSTLKFAQRAKLIQNNAVVNEDASGDVIALQHQIQLLKEELSVLKRQNVSRSLSFRSAIFGDTDREGHDTSPEEILEMDCESDDDSHKSASLGVVRMSIKQLKSLETTLAGALRREKMADTSIKQLEAEIEQLNRLVQQREEDTRGTKMMLRFREDKIQRMESLLSGFMPSDTYFIEENNALSEELQLLRASVDRNPEVIRFALENIRLLDKLRRFQDFYEEGEREILLEEVSELRDQLIQFLPGNTSRYYHSNPKMTPQGTEPVNTENNSYHFELKKTQKELEDCRNNLNSSLEINAKLTREINDLYSQLDNLKSARYNHNADDEPHTESSMKVQTFDDNDLLEAVQKEKARWMHETVMKPTEEIMNLELELDILKIILQEERQSRGEAEEHASCLSSQLEKANDRCLRISAQWEDASQKYQDAKSVLEALESQQILLIDELEDLRESNSHHLELMSKQEREISVLKEQLCSQELRTPTSLEQAESGDSLLQVKLNRMQDSLEKAKKLNTWYQSDRAFQTSHEQEVDDVCRQVEAETAEVIVCLQEELATLQQQVKDSSAKEMETKHSLMELQERLYLMTLDKEWLGEQLEEKDAELITLSEEWEKLACEVEEIISDGHEALKEVSDEVDLIFCSFPQRTWIREKVGRMVRNISEKDSVIEELQKCLEEAQNIRIDMEWKLRSLRGAALAITEVQQQERIEKEKEVVMLTSKLAERTSVIRDLENKIKLREDLIGKTDTCAMAAFVIVNRLSEKNCDSLAVIEEAEEKIRSLKMELEASKESCVKLKLKLSEEEELVCAMERKLEEVGKDVLSKTKDKLDEFKLGLSTLNSCMSKYPGWNDPICVDGGSEELTEIEESQGISKKESHFVGDSLVNPGWSACIGIDGDSKGLTEIKTSEDISKQESWLVGDMKDDTTENSFKIGKNVNGSPCKLENLESERAHKDVCDTDLPILLLRKELESALKSLKGVQAQMVKLLKEKEEISKSEKQSRKSMEILNFQVLTLQEKVSNTEKQSDLKMMELDHKLQTVEQMAQEAGTYWFQKKEVLELELSEAKLVASQKHAEASSLLAKFEEAQGTLKEADLMVNALMTANEASKRETERLKRVEGALTNERDFLIEEARCLQSSIDQKDQQYDNLEKQYCSDLSEARNLFISLEDIIVQVQTTFKEEFKSIVCDFQCLKSQLLHSTKLTRSWLEDIWSDIIVKDCAVSVLHLCHMGVLLEAVTGLNVENGLLHHGLCESNSVIADLREHNSKAKRELEMCRILKGKLLVDIKNSFDRISRKEDETGKLSGKLSSFEKKILDLQLQEEFMMARSNSMGSELMVLMKELDLSNTNASKTLLDQEELIKSQVEIFMTDLTAKEFESFILASELKQMSFQKADLERERVTLSAVLENLKKEVIFLRVEVDLEKHLFMDTEAEMDQVNKVLECDIQSLKEIVCSNDTLRDELTEVKETKERLSAQVQVLETETKQLIEDLGMKETELDRKVMELTKMSSIEEENETLKNEVRKLRGDYSRVHGDLQEKKSEFESSFSHILVFDEENRVLKEKTCYLETSIASLHVNYDMKNAELEELRHSQSIIEEELSSRTHDLEVQTNMINSLNEQNVSLRRDLMSVKQNKDEIISLLSLNGKHSVDSVQTVNMVEKRIFDVVGVRNIALLDKMFQEICENEERASKLSVECECLEKFTDELISENLYLNAELSRKDEVLKGMSFDLSLLQESASNAKDQKDEFLEIVAAMESLEDDLVLRSDELNETINHNQMLQAQLQEKIKLISALELDISKERKSLELVMVENVELKTQMEDALVVKSSIENDLTERSNLTERLQEELFQMDNAFGQMTTFLEGLKNDLNKVTSERDHLDSVVHALKEKLEMAQTLAEENEAIAIEARQIAESRKTYADDKEEEVKLLERSVEELECTVNVLENKVDIVKGEAERQRLQREELEMELQAIRHQMMAVQSSGVTMDIEMQNIKSGYTDVQRHLEEKENDLQDAQKQIIFLEKYISEKDAEISQCKAHISELNLHAEAQAREYKQKFKALEAMAEQVKPEPASSHLSNSSSTKLEKNASKSRGSGSPFKCIGLGLAHQINSEKDEELTAGRLRIEELEGLAASRQKEIFMLNARLAAAESMTHDVIRDLLGVKLDMSNYASLLDLQQVHKITEKAQFHSEESLVKEEEVVKLKQQLNEFIEERQGWLEEINRRHAEMVAAQIASEKLRQRDQYLTTENEMLKMENVNHKNKVMQLEDEVKKLSGQQNLQQRIHHHAKIKEENNSLKNQNADLSAKLRRTEIILSRVKEELSLYRASNGRSPSIDFDEEQRLNNKLKENEEERLQLAQKLLSLCTSILKAAGITRPVSEISPSMAEDALEQLKDRVASLERELQDLTFKSRIINERIRLSELKQQSSPLNSRTDDDSSRSRSPFLTALSR